MAQIHITQSIFAGYERIYRANLINSVTGYKPAMLIGTTNLDGQHNLAIFSSVVHLGADPALVGFIQRPVGVSGDTFRNITANGVYTINHIHEHFVEKAHYTSARFESSVSEFEACKLTPQYLEGFPAPFVSESSIKFGLELVEVVPIRHNNTSLVIGAVKHILLDEGCIEENGNLNLNSVNDVCISGLENYHQVEKLRSLPYASVKNLPAF